MALFNNNKKTIKTLEDQVKKLMAANAASDYTLRSYGATLGGGYDAADTLHNVYTDYGYPEGTTFSNHWNMYRRLGIAKAVVDLPVDTTWKTKPEIKSDNETLAEEINMLDDNISFWKRLKAVDAMQRVGRYAGLLMRVRDDKTLEQPLTDTFSGIDALVDMVPLYESQLSVIETDSNPNSENYGKPILLQYSQSAEGSNNERVNSVETIHASRVIFASEGAHDGNIYGISALECIYNSLMDLRKVVGGAAEGFYKNAAQSVILNLKDTDGISSDMSADDLQTISDNVDNFLKAPFRRAMWTAGMEVNALTHQLVSPQDHFNVIMSDIAAGSGIPSAVLIGQQTGRLAGDKDSEQFLANMQSRRENYLTSFISDIIDWLIDHGILTSTEYEIEWDDLLARSNEQKLESASKMAEINEKAFRSGLITPFTENEIREAAGFEVDDDFSNETRGELGY